MKLELGRNRDFWAGLMFFGFGIVAIFVARDYPFGRLLRMGSGYFPTLMGAILVLLGIYIMAKGLLRGEKIPGNWSVRALVVLPLMIIVFGAPYRPCGLHPGPRGPGLRIGGRQQGVQVGGGPPAYRLSHGPLRFPVHLGTGPALPPVQMVLKGILSASGAKLKEFEWICFITSCTASGSPYLFRMPCTAS